MDIGILGLTACMGIFLCYVNWKILRISEEILHVSEDILTVSADLLLYTKRLEEKI